MTISKMVSSLVADITVQAIIKQGLKKLVIAGGHTSDTISRKLRSFDGPDFLIEAPEYLKDLTLHKKQTEYSLIGVKSLFLDAPSRCEDKF